jgi:hypothetical protein
MMLKYLRWRDSFCNWVAGSLAESPEEIIRYALILGVVESAGGAVACDLSILPYSLHTRNISAPYFLI